MKKSYMSMAFVILALACSDNISFAAPACCDPNNSAAPIGSFLPQVAQRQAQGIPQSAMVQGFPPSAVRPMSPAACPACPAASGVSPQGMPQQLPPCCRPGGNSTAGPAARQSEIPAQRLGVRVVSGRGASNAAIQRNPSRRDRFEVSSQSINQGSSRSTGANMW
jgi:hypothetical protein